MKKIVLTFGLLSGLVLSVMMALTMPFAARIGFDRMMVIGYASMLAAFLLIHFGIRSYRDNVGGGTVRFGRAFAVGALIALVASACYVATWETIYFGFDSDFVEKYSAHQLAAARAKGATPAEIQSKTNELKEFAEMYDNPIYNAGMTFMEPLPVGLVIALISAAVLSRRRRVATGSVRATSAASP
jgi:hypothetical protein